MAVETVHDDWLESFRERQWLSVDGALARIREPGLRQILRDAVAGL